MKTLFASYKNSSDSADEVRPEMGARKKMKSRRKRGFLLGRIKNYRNKRNLGKVRHGELGENDKVKQLDVPDMFTSLPFTHCKIVLSLEDDNENALKGWAKEGEDFVFYDTVTSHEQKKMARHLWEYCSPRRLFPPLESSEESDPNICSSPDSEFTNLPDHDDAAVSENLESDHSGIAMKPDNFPDNEAAMEEDVPVPVPRIFNCPFCLVSFAEAGALIEHLPVHRGNMTPQVSSSDKLASPPQSAEVKEKCRGKTTLNCRQCDFSTSGMKKFERHMEIHNKEGRPVSCSHCPSYFKKNSALLSHVKNIHRQATNGEDKTISGNVAFVSNMDHPHPHEGAETSDKKDVDANEGSEALSSGEVNSEIAIHENIEIVKSNNRKRWRCKLCAKILSDKYGAILHIRAVHKKERRFNCMKCDASFFHKSNFNKHMIIHSGMRRYKCSICPRAFHRSYNLQRHMQIHLRV